MDAVKFIQKKTGCDLNGPLPIPIRMSRYNGFPKLLRELGLRVGVETESASGWYSQFLCKYIPGISFSCVDAWEADSNYESVKQRVSPYGCRLMRMSSQEALKDFPDGSLDFVYIDGNHSFQNVVNDIAEWSKKVRPGGIVAGHDFWNSRESRITYVKNLEPEEKVQLCQVKDAVIAWTTANQIKPWFVLTKDRCPTWFWVRE